MVQVCKLIGHAVDVREIVVQTQSCAANHESAGNRQTVDDLINIYEIDETLCSPEPSAICIIDDLLTAGTHYRAMHTVLKDRFPDCKIFGLFIARRKLPEVEFPDIDLEEFENIFGKGS
jgi:predicted amidophosphoribosyltransferase